MENNDRSKNDTKSNSRRKKRVDKLEGATQGEKLKFIIVGGLTAKSPTQGNSRWLCSASDAPSLIAA
jgi:hypothetical protein